MFYEEVLYFPERLKEVIGMSMEPNMICCVQSFTTFLRSKPDVTPFPDTEKIDNKMKFFPFPLIFTLIDLSFDSADLTGIR